MGETTYIDLIERLKERCKITSPLLWLPPVAAKTARPFI